MKSCPKPTPRVKAKRKRIARVSKRHDVTSWTAVRKIVMERAKGRCERITGATAEGFTTRCQFRASQVAHVHELGRRHAGGRYNPDATCPVCGVFVNQPANLKAVCSPVHNAAVARPCPGRG